MSGAVVDTSCGKVQGELKDGLQVFRGIPFAKPPVGDLRFQSPRPPEKWSGVRECTKFSPGAPQEQVPLMDVGEMSEDCLYLNIWTPGCDNRRRPVMVWIHGGGFMGGSGSQAMYEGSSLVRRGDIVLVTINYRLGALGFAYLRDILGEKHPAGANNGIQDQVAALKWVKENIERFGGDPGNVTIFGESAGGMSVGTLLGTPSAKGLFHRAIPQSGAAHHATTREDANRIGRTLLEALNIAPENAQKLWEVPYQDIIKAQRKCAMLSINVEGGRKRLPVLGMTLVPVVDGSVLPEDPHDAIVRGSARGVPVLIGTTHDEWNLFVYLTDPKKKTLDETGLVKLCNKRIPGHGERAASTYRAIHEKRGEPAKPVDLFCAIETDRTFRIPAIRLAEEQQPHESRTFMYLLDWKSPAFGGTLGSCHAMDIPFVFGTLATPFGQMLTGGGEGPKVLADKVQEAWLAFARTGNPGHKGLPEWTPYETGRRATMYLGKECRLLNDPQSEERKFWDGIL